MVDLTSTSTSSGHWNPSSSPLFIGADSNEALVAPLLKALHPDSEVGGVVCFVLFMVDVVDVVGAPSIAPLASFTSF